MGDLSDEEMNGLDATAGWMQRADAALTERDQREVGHKIDRALAEIRRHKADRLVTLRLP